MPRTSRIIDTAGQPIVLADLKREVAAPSLTGVRQPIGGDPSAGLTPASLVQMLRSAEWGTPTAYLELAEAMEEKHLHYRAVLGTRRMACAGLPLTVEAASDEAADQRAADLVRELVGGDEFVDALADALDALGKGFAVLELLWETSERDWRPRLVWRDPRWFQFARHDGRTLRLRDGSTDGGDLPPYKFVIHTPRTKAGLPIRGGLARAAAWAYLFQNLAVKDWAVFCEVFGMPVRMGKYPSGTDERDIQVLRDAVYGIGSDCAAVVPDNMSIEFIERRVSTSGVTVYEGLARWLDEQVSKAVLGQVETTSGGGGSMAKATVQNEVRHDLLRLDARQLAATLNRDVVRPYVDLNLGPQARYPRVTMTVEEPEDLAALAESLAKLVPLGLRVEQSVIRDRFGLPDPAEGADLLGAPAPVTPPAPPAPGNAPLPAAQTRSAQAQGGADPAPDQTALDAAATAQRARLQPLAEALLAPVLAAIEQADDYETALHALGEALPALPVDGLAELLARSGFAAQLHGRLSAQAEGAADA